MNREISMAGLYRDLRAGRNGLRGNDFHVRVSMREKADAIHFESRMLHRNVVHHPDPTENDDEQHEQHRFGTIQHGRAGTTHSQGGEMVNQLRDTPDDEQHGPVTRDEMADAEFGNVAMQENQSA